MLRDFFISYNHADRQWAEWIAWQLEEAGYTTVLQSWDFRPGSNFTLEMHSAAQAAERTIAVLSPDYLTAPFTLAEWAAAFAMDPTAKQGKLLPIRVRESDPGGLIRQIVYIDLVGLGEDEAKEALLIGVTRGRQKPSTQPIFPSAGVTRTEIASTTKKSSSRIRLLHLSDFHFGTTNDAILHREVLTSLVRDVIKRNENAVDALLITGDLTFSARPEEFDTASQFLSSLTGAQSSKATSNCFIVPGNHDVDFTAIGPVDHKILDGLTSEEEIARVLSHPPTMELLSGRLRAFYGFTERLLGKARGWRRDRPWRIDKRNLAGRKVAFIQLNSAWALGPAAQPLVGEFQVREALTEAGDSSIRIWLLHHPLEALRLEEYQRISRLLEEVDGHDLFFRGTRHQDDVRALVSSRQFCLEFAGGPLSPSPINFLCSIIEFDPDQATAEVDIFRFDRDTHSWVKHLPSLGNHDKAKLKVSLHSVKRGMGDNATKAANINPAYAQRSQPQVIRKASHLRAASSIIPPQKQSSLIKSISESEFRGALGNGRPLLILTAVETELRAVLSFLTPLPRKRKVLRGHIGQETYYLGKYGTLKALVTMCGMGSIGRDSVILATQQAINEFNPKAVIMIGIAFGKDPQKQNLGDVLVASQVISYEQQRIGEQQIIHRGTIAQTGAILLNRFRQALDWQFSTEDGSEIRFHVGPLLSGEKLIDQSKYKEELFMAFPQAIGGEMEGAGLYAVASRGGVEWIIVKGICDWADGSKNDGAQVIAAQGAASLVHHVLSQPTALEAI